MLTLLPALIFAVVALFEIARPRRTLRFGRVARWRTGLLLAVTGRAALWLLAWIFAVPAVAIWAGSRGIGAFNVMALPFMGRSASRHLCCSISPCGYNIC